VKITSKYSIVNTYHIIYFSTSLMQSVLFSQHLLTKKKNEPILISFLVSSQQRAKLWLLKMKETFCISLCIRYQASPRCRRLKPQKLCDIIRKVCDFSIYVRDLEKYSSAAPPLVKILPI